MKRIVFYCLSCMLLLGCQEKQPTEPVTKIQTQKKSSFTMYEMSEMAALMEQMYVDNQRLKEKIENNEGDLGEFPDYYLNIHTATLTEPSDLDDFFKSEADHFLKAQELIYTDPTHAKKNFNNMVTACIECHTVKCTGPIERIKKLYIGG